MPQFFKKLKLWIYKEYSVSTVGLIKFVLLFIGSFFFYYTPIYLSIRLTLTEGTKFTFFQWWSSALAAFVMVVLNYFWDIFRDKRKNKKIENDKIVYDLIGGAIQELHDIKSNKPNENGHYIDEILVFIEKVVFTILHSSGTLCGILCVNYMEKEEDHLKLIKFATKFQDRDKPNIPLDEENPLPGAPEAWVYKTPIYVNDIDSPKYKEYFKGSFKFKSFISIPVMNDGIVFGVINIDSTIKDQFGNDDYIVKKILPKINPLLLLFVFESELFKK